MFFNTLSVSKFSSWNKPIYDEEKVFSIVSNIAAANEIHVSSEAELEVPGNIKVIKQLPHICLCAGATQPTSVLV